MLMVTPTVLPDGFVAFVEGSSYPNESWALCPLRAAYYAIVMERLWRIENRA
jgi:hypothetical protein